MNNIHAQGLEPVEAQEQWGELELLAILASERKPKRVKKRKTRRDVLTSVLLTNNELMEGR